MNTFGATKKQNYIAISGSLLCIYHTMLQAMLLAVCVVLCAKRKTHQRLNTQVAWNMCAVLFILHQIALN